MLFLNGSNLYTTEAEEVSLAEALAEQLEATLLENQFNAALLEADFIFHRQVLTESEDEKSSSTKKAGFLRRVFEKIAAVFQRIIAAVRKLIAAIKGFFSRFKKTKEDEIEAKAKKAGVDKNKMGMMVKKGMIKGYLELFDVIENWRKKIEGLEAGEPSDLDKAEIAQNELSAELGKHYKAADDAAKEDLEFLPYPEWKVAVEKLKKAEKVASDLKDTLEVEQEYIDKAEAKMVALEKNADSEFDAELRKAQNEVKVFRIKLSMLNSLSLQCSLLVTGCKLLLTAKVVPPSEKG